MAPQAVTAGANKLFLPLASASSSTQAVSPITSPTNPSPPRNPSAPPNNAACTIDVSANGASGTISVQAAIAKAGPGSVICMRAGQYTINSTLSVSKAGRPDAWIVLKAHSGQKVDIVWDPARQVRFGGIPMIFFTGTSASYWEVRDLNLNASGQANSGVFCRGGHHIRVINTNIQNGDESGISTVDCDYITAIGNRIYKGGYGRGWSSGISLNKSRWHDRYTGIHSVILGNTISGMYDNSTYHTDGNGIILDLSAGYNSSLSEISQANTPPALIANNVVYNNGGKCIDSYGASNGWIVNNTCYGNAQDSTLRGPGEIKIKSSKNVVVANNIAYGSRSPYLVSESTEVKLVNNLYFGSANITGAATTSALINKDPMFTNPPVGSTYQNALAPWTIDTHFVPKEGSPAINAGVDPRTLTSDANLKTDLQVLLATDATGTARVKGEQYDLGAYELR